MHESLAHFKDYLIEIITPKKKPQHTLRLFLLLIQIQFNEIF
jgi:hypothetical protein